MPEKRSDHVLVSWLYRTFGLKSTHWWQALPHIQIPGDKMVGHALHFRGPDDVEEVFSRIPFETFTFSVLELNPIQLIGVFSSSEGRSDLTCLYAGAKGNPCAVASISYKEGKQGAIKYGGGDEKGTGRPPDTVCRQLLEAGLASVQMIALTNDRLVAVQQDSPRTKRQRRHDSSARKERPWMRTDLKRYILLQPGHARDHGHPQGTHASPEPHQRRAHWATLRHPRYGQNVGKKVWRRSTWVGDPEWVWNGNRYKVLEDHDAD